MPYKNILFDLDGTLTDSQEGIINSIVYSLDKLGLDVPERSELVSFIGPPLITSYMSRFSMTREEAERAIDVYREYFVSRGMFENRVYDGIPELLSELRRRGCALAVATSKPEPYSRRIIEHFGLNEYFSFVCGSTLDEQRVAKSEVIEYALASMGVKERSQTVMVGDRHHDADGAKSCGLDCIGVLYGFGSREELTAAGATALAATPSELLELLAAEG